MFENDNIEEHLQGNLNQPTKKKLILTIILIIIVVIAVIITAVLLAIKFKKDKDNKSNLDFEINTVNFNPDIIYIGSHYNYDGDLLLIYKKNTSENYFVGISNDKGDILKEIYEFKDGEVDTTYINRASSFSDGKMNLNFLSN